MSRFKPVDVPVTFDGRVSQTALRHFAQCARSAYLYQRFRGEASTPEMQRGSALHAVHERGVRAALDTDNVRIPPELLKAIVDEVLADPEFHVPFEEHDYIREMAWRLGEEVLIDPSASWRARRCSCCEVAGYAVRCRIDFAELREGGAVCYVEDLKSSRALPPYEEISRKRSDGSLVAKNFQLVLYALVLAFGVPVRIEECPDCAAGGYDDPAASRGARSSRCRATVRRPRLPRESRSRSPVAARAQRFDLEFVYPGIEDREGKIVRRPVSPVPHRAGGVPGVAGRAAGAAQNSEESGDWPAVASDGVRGVPGAGAVPDPLELRDHRGTINSLEQASEAAEVLYREKAEHGGPSAGAAGVGEGARRQVPFGRTWSGGWSTASRRSG
jgi:hypothetical protein